MRDNTIGFPEITVVIIVKGVCAITCQLIGIIEGVGHAIVVDQISPHPTTPKTTTQATLPAWKQGS